MNIAHFFFCVDRLPVQGEGGRRPQITYSVARFARGEREFLQILHPHDDEA
jgi:hypothetical protein